MGGTLSFLRISSIRTQRTTRFIPCCADDSPTHTDRRLVNLPRTQR